MLPPSEGKKLQIEELFAEWRRLCEIEKDVHAAVCSDEGDGKSHLTSEIVTGKEFHGNLWDNMVYTNNPKEFYDKYDNLPGHEVSIMGIDEALNLLDRCDWAKVETKDLVKKFRGDVRKEKAAIFLYNIQLFRDLHGYWRNHRIRYWIELTPREWFEGVNFAYVMNRQRVPFITGKRDAWLLDDQEKMWLSRMQQGAIIGEQYVSMLRQNPFYKGEFKFERLTEHKEKEYIKRRLEAKETYEGGESAELAREEKANKYDKLWRARFYQLAQCVAPKLKMNESAVGNLVGMAPKMYVTIREKFGLTLPVQPPAQNTTQAHTP